MPHRLAPGRRLTSLLAASIAGLALAPLAAIAGGDPFTAQTVPWVPTAPDIPHSAISGQPAILQAVARGACAGPITYQWDVDGDGVDDTAPVEAASRHDLSHVHTYEVAEETVFVARVTARCGAVTSSATFPVRVHVEPTLRHRVDRAISHGMWWGHVTLQRDEAAGTALLPTLAQAGLGFGVSDPQADTAALLQVYLNRGHRAGVDPADDPYRADVDGMMRYLLGLYREFPLVDALRAGEDPDRNGNQLALRPVTTSPGLGYDSYVGGGMLEAIASFGDPDIVLAADLPAGVAGRQLRDAVQDMVDFYLWQQSVRPAGDVILGGWNYNVPSDDCDVSLSGWTTVALAAARDHVGAGVPAWALDRLEAGLMATDTGVIAGGMPRGVYNYSIGIPGGPTPAKSGAALTGFGLIYGRDPSAAPVQAAVRAIADWFVNPPGDAYFGNVGNMYAMYQVAKGLRSFEPPFEIIGDGIDWYAIYAEHILSVQEPDGRVVGAPEQYWIGPRAIGHGLALLILVPSVFDALPVATARATPRAVVGGETVRFTHGESYALDPAAPLVWFRWDVVRYPEGLDANGDGDLDDPGDIAAEDLNGDGLVSGAEVVWEMVTGDIGAALEWVHAVRFDDDTPQVVRARLQVEDVLGRVAEDTVDVTITPRPAPGLVAEPVVVVEGEVARVEPGVEAPPGEAATVTWACPPALSHRVEADGTLVVDATALDGPAAPLVFECVVTARLDGSPSATAAVEVSVPNRAPTIEALALAGPAAIGEPVGLVVVGEDAPADQPVLVYGVDCDGDGLFEIEGVGADELACTFGEGAHRPVVSVEDDDGGRSERALDVVVDNVAPRVLAVVCPEATEGERVVLAIEVVDPGDPITCALVDPIQDGASLDAETCRFEWTPSYLQARASAVDFAAEARDDDDALGRVEWQCPVRFVDEDGDGLPDTWERENGTDPTVPDGDADPDGDGVPNSGEYEGDTDPLTPNLGPPTLVRPIDDVEVETVTPTLVVTGPAGATTYDLRLWPAGAAADAEPLWVAEGVAVAGDETAVAVPDGVLAGGEVYEWTARASDGPLVSVYAARARFRVALQTPDAMVMDAMVTDAMVMDAMVDAGAPDDVFDRGVPAPDGRVDLGAPAPDGSAPRVDGTVGGGIDGDVIQGTGCACDAGEGDSGSPWLWWALLALGVRQRRRR
ncbi:MAG: MYXO-CTERM sorting domain-containing protein [bacterium]